ncbi:MAG: hypothetical protein ACPL88_03700, partial [Bryobacteraceae bacterium]
MRFLFALGLAGISGFLASSWAAPAWAGCMPNCPPCVPCPDIDVWEPIHAVPEPLDPNDPSKGGVVKLCRRSCNPDGSGNWGAEQWAWFAGCRIEQLWDKDRGTKIYHWEVDPANCNCYPKGEDLEWQVAGKLRVIWSGSVDLTTVGTDTLTATVVEENTGSLPCPCDAAIDEARVFTFTVEVVQCWEWEKELPDDQPPEKDGANTAQGQLCAGYDTSPSSPTIAYSKVWGHPGAARHLGQPYSSFDGFAKVFGASHTEKYKCVCLHPELGGAPPYSRFRINVLRRFVFASDGNPFSGIAPFVGAVRVSGSANQAVSTSMGCGKSGSLSLSCNSREQLTATGGGTLSWPPAISLNLGISGASWDTGVVVQVDR